MKLIPLHPLNRGNFAQIDDEDYEYISKFRWQHLATTSGVAYAYTNLKLANGYSMTAGMHRVIMGDREPYEGWADEHRVCRVTMPNGLILLKGDKQSGGNKRLTVVHIDRNGLNNTRSNLRFATAGEQNSNRCSCRYNSKNKCRFCLSENLEA